MTIRTIDDIKAANRALGHHFFDKSSMRFFRSRVSDWTLPLADGSCLFITSEQFQPSSGPAARRLYTLRICKPNGDCGTVGEFQRYMTARGAQNAGVREAKATAAVVAAVATPAEEVSP